MPRKQTKRVSPQKKQQDDAGSSSSSPPQENASSPKKRTKEATQTNEPESKRRQLEKVPSKIKQEMVEEHEEERSNITLVPISVVTKIGGIKIKQEVIENDEEMLIQNNQEQEQLETKERKEPILIVDEPKVFDVDQEDDENNSPVITQEVPDLNASTYYADGAYEGESLDAEDEKLYSLIVSNDNSLIHKRLEYQVQLDKMQKVAVEFSDLKSFTKDESKKKIVDYHMHLLNQQTGIESKYYCFNSSFYDELVKGESVDYKRVSNWTNGIDLFSCDYIIVPVYSRITRHWILLVVDFQNRFFSKYDSAKETRYMYKELLHLKEYMIAERDAKKKVIKNNDFEKWATYVPEEIPEKGENQSGIVVCAYADCITKHKIMDFYSKDMEYHKKVIAIQTLKNMK